MKTKGAEKTGNVLTKAIESCRGRLHSPRDEIRKRVEELLSQPLLPHEQEKVYSSLWRFAAVHFAHQIDQRYHLISSEIDDLKRQQVVQAGEGKYRAELPVVVSIPLEEQTAGVFKKRLKAMRLENGQDYGEREIDVSCFIPEIIPEARIALVESIKFNADITAKAYQDPLICKILTHDKFAGGKIPLPLDSEYRLLWAPSTWDAKIVERDPALVMRYAGSDFLVHQWDIPEERSLDALLREFRENV